jgi:multicomponent Na+:H+ antiporter subunit D
VFSVLKIVVYIFGLKTLDGTGLSTWLLVVASVTIVTASCIAIAQDNLKRRLAYSTNSQLSYIVLGAALATRASVLGGAMHIAMHAVAKITLFFCAGAIYVAAHKTRVSELDGIGRKMPFTMGAFLLGSLSLIGVPPFGGMWSKWHLALGAAGPDTWPFIWVLMLSSLLSIAYLMPVVARAFFRAPEGGATGSHTAMAEAPVLCVVPLCMTAVGSVLLFFFAERIYRMLEPIVQTGGVG